MIETDISIFTDKALCCNPRVVKEADALSSKGYGVLVVAINWSDDDYLKDLNLLKDKKWKCIHLNFNKSNFRGYVNWFFSGVKKKLAIKFPFVPKLTRSIWLRNLYYRMMMRVGSKIKSRLYISHYGTLPVVVNLSRKFNCACAYDFEDYHSLELDAGIINQKFMDASRCLESEYLSSCDFIISSSPLIAKKVREDYSLDSTVILNVFSSTDYEILTTKNEHLCLYWFSQTIGPGRGLEDVIKAMAISKNKTKLFLQGRIGDEYLGELTNLMKYCGVNPLDLVFLDSCMPDDLVKFASKYDVGLCLEQKVPENRNICLTNKLFTYLWSGLSIIGTETDAQKLISDDLGNAMWTYLDSDVKSLSNRIDFLSENLKALHDSKKSSRSLFHKKYNWDQEKKKLLVLVEKLLK